MENKTIQNIIALSMIKGVGSAFIKKNLFLIRKNKENLLELSKIGGKVDLDKLNENIEEANNIISDCKK